MLKNINTIVTDMDDTLLDGEGKLSDYTLRVMAECKRRGIRLIPASGRTHASLRPYVEKLDTGMPYIGGNGAEIVGADHQLLEQIVFDHELACDIIRFLEAEHMYVQIYRDPEFYYAKECAEAESYKRSSGLTGVEVGDLCAFLTFGTSKILSVADPAEVERVRPLISKRFEGRAIFSVSKPYFLEAEPIGGTKGDGLRRLAAMRGDITPERTIAFGDSLNDLSLLSFTPHSVAVGNAREELKQYAAHVCRPNTEDGLARFIEEHVLGIKEEAH